MGKLHLAKRKFKVKTKYLTIVACTILIIGCTSENEKSEIEIIKYDPELLEEIQSNYDSTYTESPRRDDFWTIEHYLVSAEYENIIFKDSLDNIVGIVKRQNGKNYFTAEYYPNGQLKGRINYSSPGIIDGPSKYYYPDGRISSEGLWKDFKKVGEWKNYHSDGQLETIDFYVNGRKERTEKIKN